jgi:hypothetical protein
MPNKLLLARKFFSNQSDNAAIQHSLTTMQCNALKNKIPNQFENEKSLKTAAAAAATQRLSASKMDKISSLPFRTTYLGMQSSKSGCKWEIFLATHSESCRIYAIMFKVRMQMGN